MKRLLFIILLAFGSLATFAQIPTKYVNLLPSYPAAIGEVTTDNYVYTNSGLYRKDIILDSLPHYEIEQIPNQTVRFLQDGIGFYVKADSLHSNHVVYSYEVNPQPIGPFEFNSTTGRFKFYPDANDYMPFTVTFTASAGGNSLSQTVNFDILAEVVPESVTIQSVGEMPSPQDYIIIAESHTQMTLNNVENRTVYSYSISGKDIVFDNNVQNKVWGLSGREDIYELNLFAERLYIRSALEFPQTNVTIYARELIFEDNGNEIASINTTPSPLETLTNFVGMNGGNSGNITLHVKNLKADFAKRFILNGTQGQCTNLNGTPGNGGDGGVLAAPINIEGYGDFARGSAGVKYDTLNSVIGAGRAGVNGHFERITDHYSWIHPYYIAAVLRHLNDSYLNNYYSYSKNTAYDYYNLINEFEASNEREDIDSTLNVELLDQATELEGLLYRLNDNLDYFGNPIGWAPMLSFEVYLNNYNNEIDRAMPTLYLNYWLQHVDQTQANWVEAKRVATEQTQTDIAAAQDRINSLINDIPILEDKIRVIKGLLVEDSIKLVQLNNELMRKAKHNVKKKNRLNKAFGICKAALNCIPGYGQIASAAVGFAGSYFGLADTYGYESALTSTFQGIIDFKLDDKVRDLNHTIDSIDMNHLGQAGKELKKYYKEFDDILKPLYGTITGLQSVLAKGSATDDQVQKELENLRKQSAEYQSLIADIETLKHKNEELAIHLKKTMNDIFSLTSEASNEMVTLDALRNDVFEGNSQRDLQAMQCVEKMRQRAMNRLVKYHYYMRKAYEYRLMRPYQGDYSLEYMYDRLEVLIGQAITDQGNSFDNSSPAGFTNYSTLSALFREEVSGVIEDVVDELTYNAPEQTATIPFVIPKEVLNKINANEEYILNMFELGLFSPDEENIRIVGFDVQYMEAHVEGNVGMSTYLDLDLQHSGISKFRKNGEVYWFNHISTSTQNPHPNTWSIRYNPLTQQTSVIEPSFATQSLLYSLLNGNANNIMLFSRPAAWSDIFVSKKVHTSGNANVVIDSLVLSLQYDFTRRPDAIRNIDITTSDGLLPYITCSEADRNGRSNGKGNFSRSYTRNNGMVTFTTMETHGNYHFVNWTDRLGNVVSENTALTTNKMTDQFYRANYELWIPVISVADTIHVGNEGGEYMVQIRNVGLGDIEMDWYVSDSLSTWVQIDGIAEGIDDGYFTFTYEPFNGQGSRIDSLEILAPEIEGMSKTIYIVQYDHAVNHVIAASANPTNGGTVSGSGTYNVGSDCTVTATANTGYIFSNWTENGEIVSTEAYYTFTVTTNRNLVANFITDYHWDVNIYSYSNSMTIVGIIQINEVEQTTNTLEIGAFCGDECRGREHLTDQYYTLFGHYYVFLTVYGDNGNTINFRLYDHSLGMELDLVCAPMTFVTNNTAGSLVNPYVFDFGLNNTTQTTSLFQGWNWWSTYIDMDGYNSLAMLEEALGTNALQIKSQSDFAQYLEIPGYGGYWYGTLDTILSNSQTYMIQAASNSQVELIGTPVSPADHPITILPGWNWIGFPSSTAISFADAFAGFTPTDGDQVKSQNGFSQYMEIAGYGGLWYGGLEAGNLTPGMGLMYKSMDSGTATLVYPNAGRSVENLVSIEKHWINDIHAYPNNMTVMAVVELDGVELNSDRYELAAFANGECRGSAKLTFVEPFNRHMAFLTISGDEATELSFGLYDSQIGTEIFDCSDLLTYSTDATVGKLDEPMIVRFNGTNSIDEIERNLHIYPNPVSCGEHVSITLSIDSKVHIEIIDALGTKVSSETTAQAPAYILAPSTPGVFTIRITVGGKGVYNRKLIVK